MKDRLINFLKSEGIGTEETQEGYLIFNRNNVNYLFATDNKDPYYFRLITPSILRVENNEEDIRELINKLNEEFKVAKIALVQNEVWSTTEQFIYSMENIEQLFKRCIIVLEIVVNKIREEQTND